MRLSAPQPDYIGGDRARLASSHWVRGQRPGGTSQQRRATIQDWMHAHVNGRWVRSNRTQKRLSRNAPGLAGLLDMRWACGGKDVPVRTYASNSAPRWALSRSDSPNMQVAMQLLDVNLGRAIPDPSEKAATYILDGHPCYDALRVKSLPSGAQKTIRGHTLPASRSQCPHLAVIVPDGCSFEILDESVIVFCDEHGREYIRTRPATGWWGGNADGPSINSGGVGRIHIVEDDQINVEGREARTIRLVPVAADWAAWDGSRFYLDPTATLTADAATEDAMIFTANTTNNYGSYPYQAAGLASDSGATWKELIQFTDPANDIPAGAITGFAYYAYPFPISGWSVSPSTITFSALSNTEAGVVMGTTSGSAQAGSCCYAYRAYDATTPTAWGGGAGSPDVEAGTASGTYNESTAAYQSASWSTQWAEDMRDGVLTAATVLAEGSGAVGAMYFMRGRESGSNEPYWEIDYNDAPVGGIANRWLVMR